jgi:phage FluMu protein gp41
VGKISPVAAPGVIGLSLPGLNDFFMKIASLTEIKRELDTIPGDGLVRICLRLAAYRKENKELLHYLLFESHQEDGYVNAIREEVTVAFAEMNAGTMYLAKKSIRRILRTLKKYIRYSGNKQTEVELLIHFCEAVKALNLPLRESKVLMNLYERQLASIEKALSTLHEDLQADYRGRVEELKS